MQRRLTTQRKIIYDAICGLKHATVEDIINKLKNTDIGIATIYRNVAVLLEQGYISKFHVDGLSDYYDHNVTKHYHLKCQKCLKITDINLDYLEGLNETVSKDNNVDIIDHSIIFNGICIDCKKMEE